MVIKLWYELGWDSGNDQPWDFGLSCSPKSMRVLFDALPNQ
jgi:hypothetical protein